MKTRFLGGSLAALLLALALAGCGGKTAPGSTTDVAGTTPSDALATVGTAQITRGDLDTMLEGAVGRQALPQLIDSQLLTEALKAKGGSVSEDEVSTEVARLSANDPTLKEAVDAGGPRAQVARQQVRRALTTAKLLTEGIVADDTKVQAFFKQYGAYYGTPLQVKIGILASSTKARADILSRALQTKPDSFEALVAQQKKTNDPIGSQSTSDTGRFQPVEQVFGSAPALAPLTKLLTTAKKGQVLPLQAVTPKGPFLIVKVVDRQEATQPDFAKVKDQVTLDYKLAQVAEPVVKKNPTNPGTLEQNIKQIIAFLAQPNPQTGAPGTKATLRDALNYILQGPSRDLLTKLRSNGSVQISDPTYKEVAQAYAAAPASAGAGAANTATSATNTATNSGAPATGNAVAPATTNSAAPATNSVSPATSGATTNSTAPATSGATNSTAPAKP